MQEDDINTLVHEAIKKDKDITYLDYVAHNKKLETHSWEKSAKGLAQLMDRYAAGI